MNIGYNQKTDESSEPIYQFFSAYSLELPKIGMFCHVAVAEDKKRPNESVVSFALSKSFKLASFFFEWDKNFANLGIKYRFKKGNAIMVSVSPIPVGSRSLHPFYLSFRYSLSENKGRKHVNSIGDSSSLSGLDSRMKAVSSSLQPKLLNERSIVINKSLEYMQKGLEAYSKKDFESALDNYHKVVELTPQFYLGYVRLGSIYYRINQIEQAKSMWRKALEINPSMNELRNSLSSLFNSKNSNQQLNFSLEDLQ
jgi:tetratricopeptide (TPR) repeat protein